jgi:DNA-damage-inducible protein J
MSQTSVIQVRIDEETKKKADTLFANLGFDTPTAIRIFLKQSLQKRGLPFQVSEEANATSKEIENHLKEFEEWNAMIDASLAEEMPSVERVNI